MVCSAGAEAIDVVAVDVNVDVVAVEMESLAVWFVVPLELMAFPATIPADAPNVTPRSTARNCNPRFLINRQITFFVGNTQAQQFKWTRLFHWKCP